MDALTELQFLEKILIAALWGGAVVLANQMVSSFDDQNLIATDPTCILQAIVVGISFLGAGTILKYVREDPGTAEGLTTGASILSVSAIGIAISAALHLRLDRR